MWKVDTMKNKKWINLMISVAIGAAFFLIPAPVFFGGGYVGQSKWWVTGFIISLVDIIIWGGLGMLWWKVLGLW